MNPDILEQLKARIERGEQQQAISTALEILQSHPNVPDVHRLLAYGYLKDSKTDDAARHLTAARELGTTAEIEIAFGRMLRADRLFGAALTCFRAAVELDPENFDAHALVAMTYESLGEFELATKYGQVCLENADREACQQPLDPLPLPDEGANFDPGNRTRNIIAYSLYGKNSYYYESAIASASMVLAIFPEWQCRFYCSAEVPKSLMNTLIRLCTSCYFRIHHVG